MNYDLLKKEFKDFGSFMIWDDSKVKNGMPENFDDKDFRDENLNPNYIYLAMNIRINWDIGDDKDFITNKEMFESKELFPGSIPPFFMFHDLHDKHKTTPYTRFSKIYTGTKLEGSYITDLFKVSPNSDKPDGYGTFDDREVFSYLNSLSENDREIFIKYQLKALDREIELLETKDPKIIVMSSISDFFKKIYDLYVYEDEFPNLSRARIVDSPSPFGSALSDELSRIIHILLVNIEDYPLNLIRTIEDNFDLIKDLREIENYDVIMAILYLAFFDKDGLAEDIRAFLENVEKSHYYKIENIKNGFSKEIVVEIIKNFGQIFHSSDINESCKYEYYSKKLNFYKGKYKLINLEDDMDGALDLLKINDLMDFSFLTSSEKIYRLVFLMKKSLAMDGELIYGRDVKKLSFYKLITMINPKNRAYVEKLIEDNDFKKTAFVFDYSYFSKDELKDLRENLANKYRPYKILNFMNEKIIILSGKDVDELFYEFYDKKLILKDRDKFDKSSLKNLDFNKDSYWLLNDLLEKIKKGNGPNFMEDCPTKGEKSYLLTNSDINKGFVDLKRASQVNISEDKLKDFKLAKKGDILIIRNSPYKSAIIEDDNRYIINENAYILKVNKKLIDPYYVLAFLSSEEFITRAKLKSDKHDKINMKFLKNTKIKALSKDKIEKIVEEMKNLVGDLRKTSYKLDKLYKKEKNIFK